MDPAVAGLIGTVVGGVLLYVINPLIQRKLDAAKANDPVLGWKTAVEEVKKTATDLAGRVAVLEAENESLERKVTLLERQDASKSAIIAAQSNMLLARDSRIAQLERLWKARHAEEPPPADPASGYWLTYVSQGGTA